MLQKLISQKSINLILLCLSVFIPFLIIDNYFAYTGFAISFIFISLLFTSFRNSITSKSIFLLILTIGLALCLFFRSNPLLIFYDFVALLYCVNLLAYPNQKPNKYNLFKLLILPIYNTISILNTKSIYDPLQIFKSRKAEKAKVSNNEQPKTKIEWDKIFLGVILTLFILGIIIPLLASTNPIFDKYISNIFNFISFNWLENILNWTSTSIFSGVTFWRIITVLFMLNYLPKALTYIQKTDFPVVKSSLERTKHDLVWFIPKVTVIGVLALFFISQIQLYQTSGVAVFDIGYTYASYVNEVFGQLSLVAFVVFNLIFFDKFYKGRSLITSGILIIEGIFLLYVGLKSDLDYILAAGLTFKRLYGLAILIWLAGIYVFFVYTIYQKKSHEWYLRLISAFTLILVLIVNVINFDNLIYTFNKNRQNSNVDYAYFAQLSSDAQIDETVLIKLANKQEDFNKPNTYQSQLRNVSSEISIIVSNIHYLKSKYSTIQIQTFNLSEYSQYLKVRDIDLSKYDKYILDYNNNYRYNAI